MGIIGPIVCAATALPVTSIPPIVVVLTPRNAVIPPAIAVWVAAQLNEKLMAETSEASATL